MNASVSRFTTSVSYLSSRYTSCDQVQQSLPTNINSEVPTDVANMLDVALTYNLTNLLTDSLTAAIAPRLSKSIFEALGE